MRHFKILIGPYHGSYKKCGSWSNYMSTGQTKRFQCESNATGISLKISMKGTGRRITLCEVSILGTGRVKLTVFFAINMHGLSDIMHVSQQ